MTDNNFISGNLMKQLIQFVNYEMITGNVDRFNVENGDKIL